MRDEFIVFCINFQFHFYSLTFNKMLRLTNTISLFAILLSLGVLYYSTRPRKFACVEGSCELVIGGEHDTLESCKNSCGSYECINNECIHIKENNVGTYTTKTACSKKCKAPAIVATVPQYSPWYYYPQSIRRPYYWNYYRNPWRREGGRRGGGRR